MNFISVQPKRNVLRQFNPSGFLFQKRDIICASNNQIREISLLYFHLMSHHVMPAFFSNTY